MTWPRARVAAVVGGVVALGAAYAFGRFSAPSRVEEREVERKVSVTLYSSHEQLAKREAKSGKGTKVKVTKPDGTVIETTGWEWASSSDTSLKRDVVQLDAKAEEHEKERIVERSAPGFLLGAGGGVRYDGLVVPQVSAVGGFRVAGPVWLLVQAQADMPVTWPPKGSVTGNVALMF